MSRRKAHFVDEEQLLKTYIIVWSVAFVWCFALKWPYSIRSLFRRRCPLSQATVVAIFQERPTNQDAYSENKGKKAVLGLQCLQNGFSRAFREFNSCMAWIFSDIDCFHCRNDGSFAFCRVHKLSNGKRYLVFQLQRCNYEEGKGFVLAVYSVGSTLGDILNGLEGLSAAAVDERLKKVGPNAFDMTKPYFLVVLGQEVTKPFYTYQLFMIWSWFPIYYYYMASKFRISTFSYL